ncbi:unnamed protein product [Parascedosporium putredinis]|uniref:Uncharacterized protein n=1 Tax=Parascedosporium putredinis TaxID=1442378 RepID=A0A9P1GZR0_9PEZI|nr:unnamed protein product [Parascedosporium putredinis]CAI7991089.1 unnamed protein product [Parascedosporium putredinis]
MPDSCEVGDLSGKYGMVAGDMILSGFLDMYTSMNPNNVAFVGNRSLILHNYAGERIACANFKPLKLSPDQTCVEDPWLSGRKRKQSQSQLRAKQVKMNQ